MARGLKRMVLRVMMLCLLPWAGAELLARRMLGRDLWFGAQGQWLSLVPGKMGVWWRAAYYHMMLRACPLDVGIEFGAMVVHSATELGNRVYLGNRTSVGWAKIGDDTLLADQVQVLSGAHQHPIAAGPSETARPAQYRRVEIGARCWLGANAVVMADVGDDSVVGAGAVVTRAVRAGTTVGGVPARPLSQRATVKAERAD